MRATPRYMLAAAALQGLFCTGLAAQVLPLLPFHSGDPVRESYPHCAGLYLARLEWEALDRHEVVDRNETIARARSFIALEFGLERANHPAGDHGEQAAMTAVERRVEAYSAFYLGQRDPERMQAFTGDPRRAVALLRCDALSGR